MTETISELQQNLREQLEKIPITVENGVQFYVFLFSTVPELRAFFKGAENIDPQKVPKSERFHKQGQRLLLGVHLCVETMHNPVVFNAYAREMVNKHRQFKLQYAHFEAFWPLFAEYADKMIGPLRLEQKEAWNILGEQLNKEIKDYMLKLGLL